MSGTASTTAIDVNKPGGNRALLYDLLGGTYPDDTSLEPQYDPVARAILAGEIRKAGVPVVREAVVACTKVGCVRKEMDRVNVAGRG